MEHIKQSNKNKINQTEFLIGYFKNSVHLSIKNIEFISGINAFLKTIKKVMNSCKNSLDV